MRALATLRGGPNVCPAAIVEHLLSRQRAHVICLDQATCYARSAGRSPALGPVATPKPRRGTDPAQDRFLVDGVEMLAAARKRET